MPTKCWVEVPIDQEIVSVPSTGYAPIYFPPEGAKAVFFFTEETFLKVYSALINGAAATYPDEWLQVVWYFLQNVEYPVSLCDEIAAAILTCEDVQLALATVIEAPGVVQDAITELVVTSPDINTYITQITRGLTGPQITGPLIYGSCDEGVVAGKMIALVDRLDVNNQDALDILEVGTNDEEKVAAILEGIPVADELPFGDILDFVQDILEDFQENYDAVATEERKDQLARDLWCLALQQPDCAMTYEALYNFFDEKAGGAVSIPFTIAEIVAFIGTGDFGTDDLIWYGMMWLQISTILAGQQFFGMNAPKITAITNDAAPSTRWEEWDLCGTPVEPTVTLLNGYPGSSYPGGVAPVFDFEGKDIDGYDIWTVYGPVNVDGNYQIYAIDSNGLGFHVYSCIVETGSPTAWFSRASNGSDILVNPVGLDMLNIRCIDPSNMVTLRVTVGPIA